MDAEPTRTDRNIEASSELGARAVIRDRRPALRPALPRQAQTWIMLGLACLILVVILITGRPEPSAPVSMPPAATPSVSVQPERVRNLQQRLAEQEIRARETQATASIIPEVAEAPRVVTPAPVDPVVEEGRRREAQSLFADNVAFSRRSLGTAQTATPSAPTVTLPWPYPSPPLPSPVGAPAPGAPTAESQVQVSSRDSESRSTSSQQERTPVTEPPHADVREVSPRLTLLEGTVIESVLVNRLDGAFQGPVQCLITTPVYSQDRQAVVIPAGARVLGSAAPVQAWGDRRLAVHFHRLVMPDGMTHSLDSFTGLNHVGETGLSDQVDRHYLQVFGASLAIGAISGLAQFGSRGGFDMTVTDSSRQAAGASLATSTARVLDRYLNVLPTITIREGHRIKIVLTSDLHLPSYPRTTAAGSPPPAALIP
jgi:type IV secretion system protein VirB10